MKRLAFSRFLALLAIACFCLALLNLKLLQYRFGGYDLSPLIDSGWRVYLGQVPNRDFICTFPPVLYLAVALAFHIVGVYWLAVTLAGSAFPLILTLAGLRITSLLRSQFSEHQLRWLAAVYCALQTTPLLAVGFPWHSSWTAMITIYGLLVTFALCTSPPQARRIYRELFAHLCVAVALLLLAKPNVAAPILICCIVALLLAGNLRSALLGLLGGTALASLVLAFAHTSLFSIFGIYLQLTSRFRPGHYLAGILYDKDLSVGFQRWTIYAVLFPAPLWLIVQVFRPATGMPLWLRVLAVGGAIATWLGIGTNVEFALVDAPALLISAALLATVSDCLPAAVLQNARSSSSSAPPATFARAAISAATYALFALALFYGLSRARMQEIGVWAEGETCGTETTVHDRFFGTFTSCRNLLSMLDETDSAIRSLKPRSVFFGPRMEFLYARERVAPPRGLPLWWHPGSSYPFRALPHILSAFEADRPDVLIFLHDDRSHMPAKLLDLMSHDYQEVPQPPSPGYPDLADDPTAHIDVYIRR